MLLQRRVLSVIFSHAQIKVCLTDTLRENCSYKMEYEYYIMPFRSSPAFKLTVNCALREI